MSKNKHYQSGRHKEYKIANQMRDEGYDIAQRSAGSHSPVDLWCVNIKEKKIKLIQCKPDTMPMKQIRRLLEENEGLNGTFEVEFEVR